MAATGSCVVALLLCIHTDACLSYLNETDTVECAKAALKVVHFSGALIGNDEYLGKSLKSLSDYGRQIVDVIKSTPGQNDKWLWQHDLFANTVSDAFRGRVGYAVGDEKSRLKKIFGAIEIVKAAVNDYLRKHNNADSSSIDEQNIWRPNALVGLIEENINTIESVVVRDRKPSGADSLNFMPDSLFLNHIGKKAKHLVKFIQHEGVGLTWKTDDIANELSKAYNKAVDTWITNTYYDLLVYHRQVMSIVVLPMLSHTYRHVQLFQIGFRKKFKITVNVLYSSDLRLWRKFKQLFLDFLTFLALDFSPELKTLCDALKKSKLNDNLSKIVLEPLNRCIFKAMHNIDNLGLVADDKDQLSPQEKPLVRINKKQFSSDKSHGDHRELQTEIESNIQKAQNYVSDIKEKLNNFNLNIVNHFFGSIFPDEYLLSLNRF